MWKEKIGEMQMMWIVISFNLGSSILLTPGILVNTAGQDAWIPLVAGAVLGTIIMLMISRLTALYPGMSLVQYSEKILGSFAGKIIGLIWCWFALHLGALVVRNFSDFFQSELLQHTPMCLICVVLLIPVVLVLYQGVGVFGIVAQVASPVVAFFFVAITFNMIPNMKLDNLLPLFQQDFKHLAWGTVQALSFPFGESILLAGMLAHIRDPENSSRAVVKGILAAAALLLLGLIRTVLTIGVDQTQRLYYPVLEPSRREAFGFLRGLEIFIIINWFNFAFFKVTVCVYAFCRGVSDLIGSEDYKPFIIPTVLIVMFLSVLSAENIVEQVGSAAFFWPAYAVSIEVLIPLILLAAASFRNNS